MVEDESIFKKVVAVVVSFVMVISCLDFFDEEMTKADMAYIQKLDKKISWGLKYGLHVSVQFFDYPGHIQYVDNKNNTMNADYDFYTNVVKQQRTILMWKTIAKRYKGIPNQALSFITNHEPDNPARTTGLPFAPYTVDDIERVSKEGYVPEWPLYEIPPRLDEQKNPIQ